jgi:hypothetical protein
MAGAAGRDRVGATRLPAGRMSTGDRSFTGLSAVRRSMLACASVTALLVLGVSACGSDHAGNKPMELYGITPARSLEAPMAKSCSSTV